MSAGHTLNVLSGTREKPPTADDIQATVDRRAVIEQTKGMLMLAYAIDAETAFDLLRQPSRRHNLELYDLARQLRDDLLELSETEAPIDPLTVDCLLYTAHTRMHGPSPTRL
jgi:hypothetical protein